MKEIVFLDRSSVQADFKSLSFPHRWTDYETTTPDEIVSRLQNAEIAVTNKIQLRAATLRQLPNLRLIVVAATGVDCVDLDYCREHHIVVSNVRGYSVHSVPEHVFTLLLALRRNLLAHEAAARNGEWQRAQNFCVFAAPINDLHGATLGIVGYGAIGRAVEKIAEAFGMRVQISEHKNAESIRAGRASFDEVLQTSDAISLHCPLTDETRNLIGAAEFERMKKTTILINCGRGGLVDEAALVAALENKTIAGAGVDVLSQEPPRAGSSSPLLDLKNPNLIVTPHVAWASAGAQQALADQVIDNIEAFVQGEPQNRAA